MLDFLVQLDQPVPAQAGFRFQNLQAGTQLDQVNGQVNLARFTNNAFNCHGDPGEWQSGKTEQYFVRQTSMGRRHLLPGKKDGGVCLL